MQNQKEKASSLHSKIEDTPFLSVRKFAEQVDISHDTIFFGDLLKFKPRSIALCAKKSLIFVTG